MPDRWRFHEFIRGQGIYHEKICAILQKLKAITELRTGYSKYALSIHLNSAAWNIPTHCRECSLGSRDNAGGVAMHQIFHLLLIARPLNKFDQDGKQFLETDTKGGL